MKIWITGSTGMVGKALVSKLEKQAVEILCPLRSEVDLRERRLVDKYIKEKRPDTIIHLAAKVGGIQANIADPVGFLFENTSINHNVISAAHEFGVNQLINIGSSCMYPKDRSILSESDMLDGKLEPTNEGYAVSKIMSTLSCKFISKQYDKKYMTVVPCNLYGPYDCFDIDKSHMLPAIIMKLHAAKENNSSSVEIWGDGIARREFMFVNDLVDFIILVINNEIAYTDMINVGLGYDYSVNEYYQAVANVIGYEGEFVHDLSKPVGMMKKCMNVDKAHACGWMAKVSLQEGIQRTYSYYLKEVLRKQGVLT